MNDSFSVDESLSRTYNVLNNDNNPNNYTVTLDSITKNVSNGTLSTSSNGNVTYTPRRKWYGTDSFSYRSYDQKGTYSNATVSITVHEVPDVRAIDDSASYRGNGTVSASVSLVSNDIGRGLAVTSISNSNFSLSGGSISGNVSAGTYTVNYTVMDYIGETSSATATITVRRNTDPLILDLDGDGIELLNADESQANFDLDLDGDAERTAGWVAPDDGFLVWDRNGDGIINDKRELFGDSDGFSDGFANLTSLDTDGNGFIDLGDNVFGSLQIWQDKNGDGLSDSNELTSIFDVGISSINLNAMIVDNVINNNWESHRSTFTYGDGSEGQISNIWFGG